MTKLKFEMFGKNEDNIAIVDKDRNNGLGDIAYFDAVNHSIYFVFMNVVKGIDLVGD